ncbi:MAG: mechanosensitive ion channel domain-containing protein [Cuniculiplasma sp.]
MDEQERGSLWKSVISIIIAVLVVYLFEIEYPVIASILSIPQGYDTYVKDAFVALIIGIISMVLLKIFKRLFSQIGTRSNGERNLNGVYIIIRIVIYAIAITIFLLYVGINLQGALIGGAIGGVIIGFAIQSVVTSILSGILVTAGGFLKPEETISIFSWMFPETLTGTVEDVKTLHTRVRMTNGRSILIPNTILFGSAIFTKLNEGRKIRYQFVSTMPADTNASEIMDSLNLKKDQIKSDLKLQEFDFFLNQKNGMTNSILFIIQFEDITNLNSYMDRINVEVERSYWEIKNKPKN